MDFKNILDPSRFVNAADAGLALMEACGDDFEALRILESLPEEFRKKDPDWFKAVELFVQGMAIGGNLADEEIKELSEGVPFADPEEPVRIEMPDREDGE